MNENKTSIPMRKEFRQLLYEDKMKLQSELIIKREIKKALSWEQYLRRRLNGFIREEDEQAVYDEQHNAVLSGEPVENSQ